MVQQRRYGMSGSRNTARLATALAFVVVATVMARSEAITVQDANGKSVVIQNNSRIVSIGGAITEILYALGLDQRVVAIDTTSLYPPQALREKPNIGYMRALSTEGVLGLNPSLILAAEDAGPKEAIAVLRTAGIPLVSVPEHHTAPGIIEKIEIVAAAAGNTERGGCLAKIVAADLATLTQIRARIDRPLKALFVLSLMNDRALVAGRSTAADGIISLAGATNAITDYEGYKPISDEAIIAAKPDFILAMSRDTHPLDAQTVFARPAFALTPAATRRSFIAMNGLYLLGFGPRTALAARDLAATIYPALSPGRLPSEEGGARAETCRG